MAEYFSHDYDAREDEKIIDLMADSGWAGYGLYWGLIELLYKNNGKMQLQYERIAYALNSHPETVKKLIEEYDLFTVKQNYFMSESVSRRLKKRKDISASARKSAQIRWSKRNASAMRSQCDGNAKKERKENKENKDIPTFDELKKYAIENKPSVNLIELKLKYESWVVNGWRDGNDKPIKNWRSKLLHTIPYLKENQISTRPDRKIITHE